MKKHSQNNFPVLMTFKDFGLLIGIPLATLTAWLLPEKFWNALAKWVAPFTTSVISVEQDELIRKIEAATGKRKLVNTPKEIAINLVSCEILKTFQNMRDFKPGNWTPEIELVGLEHIDSALNIGRGAIIWDSHFYFANLVTKIALHRAGYEIHHLSHPEHGFSPSRFGIRFLNPIRGHSENHYLKERVVINPDIPKTAMQILEARLNSNAIVSITVSDRGRRPIIVPFLNSEICIAPGAQLLAIKTGAALIPGFTFQTSPLHYQVTLAPPLHIPETSCLDTAITALTNAYVHQLEKNVLTCPSEWVGWMNVPLKN
jgi:lauroyl/myristoyl acyltransferase